ncbi:MAG: hypothetical protein ACK40G_13265 [Cytophagaceae bacterium]
MQVRFTYPLNHSVDNLADFLSKLKEAGYDGVEMQLPKEKVEKFILKHVLKDLNLLFVATIKLEYNTFEEYFTAYINALNDLQEFEPVAINSVTGKSWFSFEQNCRLIEEAALFAVKTGIKVYHKADRNGFAFHPAVVGNYIKTFANLEFTSDFSEWVIASGMEPNRFKNLCGDISFSHINCKIADTNTAQISDPRAPEFSGLMEQYIKSWEEIVANACRTEKALVTINTAFDQACAPKLPYSNMPVSNAWDINLYLLKTLSEAFAKYAAKAEQTQKVKVELKEEEKSILVKMERHQLN